MIKIMFFVRIKKESFKKDWVDSWMNGWVNGWK